MKYFRWATLAAVALGTSGAHAQNENAPAIAAIVKQIDALAWVHGPSTVRVGDEASVQLPRGIRYLDPSGTSKFLEINGNPPTNNDYTIAPEATTWFAILEFDPAGYVSDKEKVDPAALFKQLKANEGAENEQRKSLGKDSIYLDRWLVEPHYDNASHNLEWGTLMHSDRGGSIVNYTSRILGRDGVTKAILVSDPTNFAVDLRQYRNALASFAYEPTKRYEAHQTGDKLAAYGLGALVAGGAAAVVAKSGLFAGLFAIILKFGVAFYKLIVVGAVTLFAALRSRLTALFRRNRQGDDV